MFACIQAPEMLQSDLIFGGDTTESRHLLTTQNLCKILITAYKLLV